jgi:hypothetical protein
MLLEFDSLNIAFGNNDVPKRSRKNSKTKNLRKCYNTQLRG